MPDSSPRPVTPDEVPDKAWEEFLHTQTGGVRDPYSIQFDVIDMERAFQAGMEAGKGGYGD